MSVSAERLEFPGGSTPGSSSRILQCAFLLCNPLLSDNNIPGSRLSLMYLCIWTKNYVTNFQSPHHMDSLLPWPGLATPCQAAPVQTPSTPCPRVHTRPPTVWMLPYSAWALSPCCEPPWVAGVHPADLGLTALKLGHSGSKGEGGGAPEILNTHT